MNANAQMIDTLAKSGIFQDYERAFTDATGLPVALRPVETWQLPLHGRRKENPWCAMMAGRSRTCSACLVTQASLAKAATNEACTVTCSYGLNETAVPVKLGAETIGFLQTGQVMRQKPTEKAFEQAFSQAEKLVDDLDRESAHAAYMDTPVMSAKKMESVSRLLAIFAEHLAMKSNQIAVQSANSEPPVIAKAKQFINDNYAEDITLGQVAAAVHTSQFYFCKIFKKSVGINFTEYVSRLRTEKAKNLLLNPNLRVSEIAYAVGFQSLTHFNRVFRDIVGSSPTEFRSHLTESI